MPEDAPPIGDPLSPLIGQRIVIIGSSSTGKSTLAAQLAELIDGAGIELDALFWLPDWQQPSAEDFQAKVRTAIDASPRWVTSGNYFSKGVPDITWAEGDTAIWLDLPFRTLFPRLLRRTWRRWRDDELLWGTNRENVWQHFKLWSDDSLPGYVIRNHRRHRRRFAEMFADPRWAHLQRHHLRSPAEVTRFLNQVESQIERAVTDA